VKKSKTSVFALQELLKQCLAMSRYITAISYQLKTNCGKAIAIVFDGRTHYIAAAKYN